MFPIGVTSCGLAVTLKSAHMFHAAVRQMGQRVDPFLHVCINEPTKTCHHQLKCHLQMSCFLSPPTSVMTGQVGGASHFGGGALFLLSGSPYWRYIVTTLQPTSQREFILDEYRGGEGGPAKVHSSREILPFPENETTQNIFYGKRGQNKCF